MVETLRDSSFVACPSQSLQIHMCPKPRPDDNAEGDSMSEEEEAEHYNFGNEVLHFS